GTKRVFTDAQRHGHDHIAAHREEVAAHDIAVGPLHFEEAGHIREFPLEAENASAQPACRATEDHVLRTLVQLGTDVEHGLAAKGSADERHEEIVGPGFAWVTAQDDEQQSRDRRCARGQAQGKKAWRKVLAKMDVVTSPASSANGAVNPSLLARRISVSRRLGIFTISDE